MYHIRTLNANKQFNRKTCTEITETRNWGIIQTIKVLNGGLKPISSKLNSKKILSLLSSYQFETLIFLLFVNNGLYSPTWRAGSLPFIDIVARNLTDEKKWVGTNPRLEFEPGKEILFQIKLKRLKTTPKEHIKDIYWIVLSVPEKKRKELKVLTADWVFKAVKENPTTLSWLNISCDWYLNPINAKSVMELL